MIFKPRQPTSANLAPAKRDAEKIQPDEPTTQRGADEDATGRDAVVEAFEALARIVSREMESVKHSVAELKTKLTRRLDSEKQNVHTIVNELRQDMMARVETLRQNQEKAISELSGQSKSSIDSLRTQLQPTLEQTVKKTDQIKTELEEMLTAKERKLEEELLVLTRNLSGVQSDVERQISTSGRVSNLLNSMADVFSDPGSLPEESPRQARRAPDGQDR